MPDWIALGEALAKNGIPSANLASARAVGGGDISAAWQIQTDRGPVFLKTATSAMVDAFSAEADGLNELQQTHTVRVPNVLAVGALQNDSYLALEWLDLTPSSAGDDRLLGEQLARLHAQTADRFGWQRNNSIGRTLQTNTWTDSWPEFYRDHRLLFQLELAEQNGFGSALKESGAELAEKLPEFFSHHAPVPSLVHGDLCAGNRSSANGQPVIFDPAVYYGDRESDLAMTRLFGGFSTEFYRAYEESWPLAPGHEKRLGIYQLYHVLNHLNLFGRGYLDQASALIRRVLRQIR